MRMHVLEFLERLKDIYGRGSDLNSFDGQCMKVHILLKLLYPQAKGYYNTSHVLTEIDNHYYDLNGEFTGSKDEFLPITHWSKEQLKTQFRDIDSKFLMSGIDIVGK